MRFRTPFPHRSRLQSAKAFTLIEILLAISIATGLLVAALLFYRQATDLRGQILKESERLATMRLMMDRLAGDLRAARVGTTAGQEFRGSGSSLSFLTSIVSLPGSGTTPGSVVAGADLMRVSISSLTALDGTNTAVIGLLRQEEATAPLSAKPATAPSLSSYSEDSPSLNLTNRVVEPTTDVIRYLRFRYWNGGLWQTGWTNTAPPAGVEIVMGTEPLPEDAFDEAGEDYPYEQFRRVVFVPAGESQLSAPGESPGDVFLP